MDDGDEHVNIANGPRLDMQSDMQEYEQAELKNLVKEASIHSVTSTH